MGKIERDSRFLKALKGERSAIPPIWMMRQAGRYLPEYRKTRAEAGSFLDLCYNSDLACEVTLQPIRRYDFDAAILFADILLIPDALGQELTFKEGEGPQLRPLMHKGLLEQFRKQDISEHLSPVYETVRKVRAALAPEKALIGFAGAPWTVATYMLAGGSQRDPGALRSVYYQDPTFVTGLIDLLVDRTSEYLLAQIEAGADAVQLFDSWAGGLPAPVLDRLSLRPLIEISKRIKQASPDTPVILFPKGVGEKALEFAAIPQCDAISIDYSMDPAWARQYLTPLTVVQGGFDPALIVAGGEEMSKRLQSYIRLFHDVPYIFNLGHGLTPDTPPDHVGAIVDMIRKTAQ